MKTVKRTQLLAPAALVACLAVAPAVLAPAALAHDAVVGANPADGATVATFPAELSLDFSGEPGSGFNTVALSHVDAGNQAEVIYSGEPEVSGRTVTLDLPGNLDPQPGEYHVGFQVISSDGHATKGMTSFTYEPANNAGPGAAESTASTGAAAATTQAAAEDGKSSGWTLPLVILGVIVVVGAGIAALAKYARLRAIESDSDKDTQTDSK